MRGLPGMFAPVYQDWAWEIECALQLAIKRWGGSSSYNISPFTRRNESPQLSRIQKLSDLVRDNVAVVGPARRSPATCHQLVLSARRLSSAATTSSPPWMLCSMAAAASCSFRVKRALARAGLLGKLLPTPRFAAIAFSRAPASTVTSRSPTRRFSTCCATYASDETRRTRERLRTVAPSLLKLAPDLAEDRPLPLNLDPEQERRRLFHEMWVFVSGLARDRSLLILVEDLHWSDEASLELLLYLIRRMAATPLALLLTYRGEEREPRSGDSWQRSIGSELRPRLCSSHSVCLRWSSRCAPSSISRGRQGLPLCAPCTSSPVGTLSSWRRFYARHRRRGHLPLARGMAPQAARSVERPAQCRGRGPATWRADEPYGPRGVDPGFGRRTPVRLRPAPLPKRARRSSPRRRYQGVDRGPTPDRGLRRSLRLPPRPHRQAVYASLMARERRALHARVAHVIESELPGSQEAVLEDLAYHHGEAEHWERAETLAREAGDRRAPSMLLRRPRTLHARHPSRDPSRRRARPWSASCARTGLRRHRRLRCRPCRLHGHALGRRGCRRPNTRPRRVARPRGLWSGRTTTRRRPGRCARSISRARWMIRQRLPAPSIGLATCTPTARRSTRHYAITRRR